jgi:hypothetical protein
MTTPLGRRLGAFGFARQARFASSPEAIGSSYTTLWDTTVGDHGDIHRSIDS